MTVNRSSIALDISTARPALSDSKATIIFAKTPLQQSKAKRQHLSELPQTPSEI